MLVWGIRTPLCVVARKQIEAIVKFRQFSLAVFKLSCGDEKNMNLLIRLRFLKFTVLLHDKVSWAKKNQIPHHMHEH